MDKSHMADFALRVELSDGRTFTHALVDGRAVVGRAAPADIVVPDSGVSREHAVLVLSADALVFEDLGATNPSRVNGTPVAGKHPLRQGDEIAIGKALLFVQPAAAQTIHFVQRRELSPVDTVRLSPAEMDQRAADNRALRALYYTGRALDATASSDAVWRQAADAARTVLDGDRAMVVWAERGRRPRPVAVVCAIADEPPVNPEAVERAIADGVAILTRDGDRSVACAPLRGTDGERGALYVDSDAARRSLTAADLDLLTILAAHTAATRTNLRLVERLRDAEQKLSAENEQLRKEVGGKYAFDELIGDSDAFVQVKTIAERVAQNDATVLITGPSGTGKEVVARAIHFNGNRRRYPFVALNCAAIPENLIEAELFGIEQGVATGVQARPGKFEVAGRGTVFLDEVGEMPLAAQAKLLRVIEEREVERVGGRETIRVQARIVSATNRDLEAEVAAGRFREDLFYRLNVVPLPMPPLSGRPGDVQLLAHHFARESAARMGETIDSIDDAAIAALAAYRWPGNVRELQNEFERIAAIWDRKGSVIGIEHLSGRVTGQPTAAAASTELPLEVGPIKPAIAKLVERAEVELIGRALEHTEGNRSRAAEVLALTREGLRTKMKRYGIE